MASFSVPCPKSSAFSAPIHGSRQRSPQQLQQSKIVFSLSPKPSPSLLAGSSLDQPLFSRFQGRNLNQSTVLKAQANEVAIEKSSNSNSAPPTKLEVPSSDVQDVEPAKETDIQAAFSDSSISGFMAEVANLVKLVDSRDIMELELKQPGCELIIRKKEAFPQPPTAAPVVMMQPSLPQAVVPSQLPAPQATSASPKALGPTPSLALPAPVKSGKSSHPPLKCPMAGTFYRSPAPGEPPLVKVGDKVEKGKVICIIEAMKLMNEIEADQSGTVVEILVDDGKPVSFDTPLFIIEP